ncbi:GH92 family glycosyl hydrolase [Silvibacterium acidisoli]|uniref:GH92 family glycosyl hydrolase n=1 Tax=Acidobacteriaceae bacterium ZG23-2 TaxID=2883246 RepID=UPI00406BFA48
MTISRRKVLKSGMAAVGGAAVAPRWLQAIVPSGRQDAGDVASFVDPIIGTGWRGHTYPGAVAPFGLVQLSPDTAGAPEPRWNVRDYTVWEHCSGYHYPDDIIHGFSHTHLQGTGGKDLGDLLVMPLVEGRNWSWQPSTVSAQAEMQRQALGEDSGWVPSAAESGYSSRFRHDREHARAGYYSVYLETPRVEAELTATARCGFHRYRFEPASSAAYGLMLDLEHGIGCAVYAATLTVESPTRLSGMRSTHGWAKDRQVYFVIEAPGGWERLTLQVDGAESEGAVGKNYTGQRIKLILTLPKGKREATLRVGISGTGIEGAAKNLAAEAAGHTFDEACAASAAAWKRILDIATVEAADAAVFYTAAYHAQTVPMTYSDIDGLYRGQDHRNHASEGFTKYTGLSIWDIYRGQFPWLSLTQPQRIDDIVKTILADARQLPEGVLPMWPLWGNETWSMNGFHAAAMILGAYVRGFRGFDIEAAYTAIRETALGGASIKKNREMQAAFRESGYVPLELRDGSVSCSLDLAYDYWCVGAMAELLGHDADAHEFYGYSANYHRLFDEGTGFMRARHTDGSWREPFRPDQEYDDYVESDGWQAGFVVPHDVAGLIALHGGDEAFLRKLEAFFTASSEIIDARPDVTGMIGQDAQGNEPGNAHPYLFVFAGAPWKTQYWVRKVASLYRSTPAGIPGNDDCGQLSSWYCFATLGFYPVNAANGVYVIGSPLAKRATLRNARTGKNFAVIAENNSKANVYIASAELNGRPLDRAWLTHAEIEQGGELRLVMSDIPNRKWGADSHLRPPSQLLRDVTRG